MAEAKEKALVVTKRDDSPYMVVKSEPAVWMDIIKTNLGGQEVTAFDLDRVRVPDGKSDFWTIPSLDESESAKEVKGILIAIRDMRAWWPDAEPSGKPPECSSGDGKYGTGKRWADDSDRQHNCKSCKYAQFGSDPKGGRGQWCKQVRALFLLRPDTFLPLVLFLPPTSIKPVKQFLLRMGSYGLSFNSVELGFGLKKDKNDEGQVYNVVEPRKTRELHPSEVEIVRQYADLARPGLQDIEMTPDDMMNDDE